MCLFIGVGGDDGDDGVLEQPAVNPGFLCVRSAGLAVARVVLRGTYARHDNDAREGGSHKPSPLCPPKGCLLGVAPPYGINGECFKEEGARKTVTASAH